MKIPHGRNVESFSYSSLTTYLECPYHYKLYYLDWVRTASKMDSFTANGIAFHDTVEKWYRLGVLTQNKLLDLWDITFDGVIKAENMDPQDLPNTGWMKGKGFNMLKTFYERQRVDGWLVRPIAIEKTFNVPLTIFGENIWLVGKVDAVFPQVAKVMYVVDWKTGAKALTQEEVDDNLQMTIYALAVEHWKLVQPEIFDTDQITVCMHFVKHDLKRFAKRDQTHFEDLQKRVEGVMSGLLNKQFEATPSDKACNYCQYKAICDFSALKPKKKPEFWVTRADRTVQPLVLPSA